MFIVLFSEIMVEKFIECVMFYFISVVVMVEDLEIRVRLLVCGKCVVMLVLSCVCGVMMFR